jgi:ketosteroid isomerase-like protein
MDYDAYVACFNTGDDAALVDRFFCDDVIFTGGTREHRGRDALAAFLAWAHDGVREVMRPQLVLRDGDHLFAEIDMDFHAVKERPDFPFGHLHPGDMVTVKFFVTYRLRGGRVAELKSMTWPPGKGVSAVPRLGAHPSQVAAFHSYVAAFGNADFDRFAKFYNDDIVLTINPQIPPIHGPDGIVAFYRPMFEQVRERLTLHNVEATDGAIRIDATSTFTAIRDAPGFILGALEEGDRIEIRVFVDYALRHGRISRISVRRGGEPVTIRARS